MRNLILSPFVVSVSLLVSGSGQVGATGFERVETADGIAAGIWYPTDAPVPPEPNTPFRQSLALGADLLGDDLPLVVVSHGDGGWMGGHAHSALALANAGYVVVALEHPGNNSEDESASPTEWMQTRPRDVSAVLDFALQDWRYSNQLDASRVGVFGFSAGGYTALVVAGATPDLSLIAEHCANTPEEFVCRIGMLDGIDADALQTELKSIEPDPRISAVSVAAPGFAFLFDTPALSEFDVPLQIWSGEIDDRVPHASNGKVVADGVSQPAEVKVVPNAGHFAFMAPCNPRLQEINPRIWAMVCVDADGFDRAAFHRDFNADLIAFFDAQLSN